MSKFSLHILLIEDNPGDVRLTQEAFLESKMKFNINVVYDGDEAIQYLNHSGSFVNKPKPDIIILDWNLPKRSGREVLINIRNNPELENIPVIVLTSSSSEKDMQQAYQLKANCYFTKPIDYSSHIKLVNSIENFWSKLCSDHKISNIESQN